MKLQCSYANKYRATRPPTCGCFVCSTKYVFKLLKDALQQHIRHGMALEMYRDGVQKLNDIRLDGLERDLLELQSKKKTAKKEKRKNGRKR